MDATGAFQFFFASLGIDNYRIVIYSAIRKHCAAHYACTVQVVF